MDACIKRYKSDLDISAMDIRARFCPKCDGDSRVVNSRTQNNGVIARTRVCRVCGYRWYTKEIPFEEKEMWGEAAP